MQSKNADLNRKLHSNVGLLAVAGTAVADMEAEQVAVASSGPQPARDELEAYRTLWAAVMTDTGLHHAVAQAMAAQGVATPTGLAQVQPMLDPAMPAALAQPIQPAAHTGAPHAMMPTGGGSAASNGFNGSINGMLALPPSQTVSVLALVASYPDGSPPEYNLSRQDGGF